MELYYKDSNTTLYSGDMNDVNSVVMDNSIDCIITDPPYELGFMGKSWDSSGIAFQKETWKHCFDVLKPGGHLLAFGGSRTFHRIACAIEDAGFEIRDTIMWVYGSGFPKSMDISKQIDKRAYNNNEAIKAKEELGKWLKEKRGNRPQKEISKYFPSKTDGLTGCVANWEKGYSLPTWEIWVKLKKILDLDDRYDYLIEDRPNNYIEAEREVIGKMKNPANSIYSMGENKMNRDVNITIPATDLAKQWQGWGTQLKPAYEPIIVARKPFNGSLVDNVITYGVGGINIEGCRIGIEQRTYKGAGKSNQKIDNHTKGDTGIGMLDGSGKDNEFTVNGRFPSNLILTYDDTDYEEVCGGFPIGGKNGSIAKPYKINNQVYGDYGYCNMWDAYNDEGSASRYFYCAKASKRDRDEGLQAFFEKTKVFNGKSKESSKSIKDVEKRFTTSLKIITPLLSPQV